MELWYPSSGINPATIPMANHMAHPNTQVVNVQIKRNRPPHVLWGAECYLALTQGKGNNFTLEEIILSKSPQENDWRFTPLISWMTSKGSVISFEPATFQRDLTLGNQTSSMPHHHILKLWVNKNWDRIHGH